jgi:hypothetical protein
MKRLTTIGLCLIGLLTTSAVAAASASAEAPEYGRCVKGVAHEGGFASATCIATDKEDNDGAYEWLPGVGAKPGFSTSSSTGVTFETVPGAKITCKSESSVGEFIGTKEMRIPTIRFNGCQSAGCAARTTGAGPEEIVTRELTGHLRFAVGGKAKRLVVNELVPTSGDLFMEFDVCTFKLEYRPEATGGLLVPVMADKMLTTSSSKYTMTKGEQKPSEYEDLEGNRVSAALEVNFVGGPFEETGWNLTDTQSNEQAIEVNGVV